MEILKKLAGIIDIYLPDFKYSDGKMTKYSSGSGTYPEITKAALLEMHLQVGVAKPDNDGLMYRGLMIRHLVTPNRVSDTKKVIEWIAENLPKDTYLNIMSQYTPVYRASKRFSHYQSLKICTRAGLLAELEKQGKTPTAKESEIAKQIIAQPSFQEKYSRQCQKQGKGVTKEVRDLLFKYSYPGNVRELENIMERAVVLTRHEYITLRDLPPNLCPNLQEKDLVPGPIGSDSSSLEDSVSVLEKELIDRALRL